MKKLPLYILLGFVLSVVSAYALKPRPDRPPVCVKESGRWICNGHEVFNEKTGKILAQAGLSYKPIRGATEDGALEFLATREQLTGVAASADHLRLAYSRDGIGTKHFTFEEVKNGVSVYPGTAVVSFDNSGSVCFLHQDLYGVHDVLDTSPSIGESTALSLACSAIQAKESDSEFLQTELIVWVGGDKPGLAWRFWIPLVCPRGDWEVIVDAHTGDVLNIRDRACYFNGTGYIFAPDPLTTAQVNYGGNYSDNNDANSTQLLAQRVLDTLRDISQSGSNYTLIGPWVRIIDWDPPTVAVVTATNLDSFRFGRAAQGFEDVNVYANVDRSQRYIQHLGFNNIQHGSIGSDSHGVSGDDNSYFVPSTNRLGFGEGGVDDAEDDDVIWHEYGHAIQHSQVPSWGGGEADAIGEGFGDYWAGSYSKSISDFHSTWVYNWDGHNEFWDGRVLNSSLHYPEAIGQEIHDAGQMWSRALMDCWTALTRDTLDQDVLQAHFFLGNGATMPSNALAIIQADIALHDGVNRRVLYDAFIARGFIDQSQAPNFALLSPNGGEELQAGEITPIRWEEGLSTNPVIIDINYHYPTGTWYTLFTGIENSGSHDWLVPDSLGTQCRIRLHLVNDNSESDSSDANFTIVSVTSGLTQYFTSTTFPPAPWQVLNSDSSRTWELFAFVNNNSARMRFFGYAPATGQKDWLITPRMNWSSGIGGLLKFSSSYDYTSNRYDSLQIRVSTDGGTTWPALLYSNGGPGLANRNHNTTEDNPNRWRRNTVFLPESLFVHPNVKLAFIGIDRNGDDLYLDSIDVVARSSNNAPEITTRTPTSLDTVLMDSSQTFSVTAVDADNDALFYHWLVDGNLVGMESTLATSFTTPSVHVIVQCRVTDGIDSTTASWEFAVISLSDADNPATALPTEYAMAAAYPNPFNPNTTINYAVPHTGLLRLSVYNLLGQEVAVLFEGTREAGRYSLNWNASGFGSGMYLVRMQAGAFEHQQKVLLLK